MSTARVEIDEPALIDFTQRLVRIRSVHEPETGSDESVAAALVADQMRAFGWEPEIAEVAPGRPNVIAVVEGGGGDGPTLAFEGHTDVVTEGAAADWTVDPYGAEIRDGRLYGRGAADMKSGVAAMLFGVRALQLGGAFRGRVVVCVLADEEGMMLGAKHFAATERAAGIDACIVCEPEGGEVCIVARGAVRIDLHFHGVMAHGAMPQQGSNPIAAAGALIAALPGYQQALRTAHGDAPAPRAGPRHPDRDGRRRPGPGQRDPRRRPRDDRRAHDPGGRARDARRAGRRAGPRRGGAVRVEAELHVIDDRPAVEIDPGAPGRARARRRPRRRAGVGAALRRRPRRHRRHDPHARRRDPHRRLRPGRQVDRPPGRRVRRGGELGRYARVYARAARAYLEGRSASQ